MLLFLLESVKEANYDCNAGFVIAANSEEEARIIAQTHRGGDETTAWEGSKTVEVQFWTNPKLASCEQIGVTCEELADLLYKPIETARIILISFKAG